MSLHSAGGSSDQPDFVQIGGPVPWFSISLSITADGLGPDEVMRLLGIEPDEARRRGVPGTRGRTPRIIRPRREQTSAWDVGKAIGMLIDRIPASAANRGLELSTDLMRRLVDMGLRLSLDIYAGEEVAYIRPVQPIG
jgi:hypothetical protein